MIRIFGDINFADWYFDKGFGVGSAIKGGQNPFCHILKSKEDFWIGNFECVCADGVTTPFVISSDILKNIPHMDLYYLANNHTMQIGDISYQSTVKILQSQNIPYCGSLKRKYEAFNYQGKKVGIFAFSLRPNNFPEQPLYWHLPEFSNFAETIFNLADSDFKMAFLRWEYEFINRPNIEQRQLVHWLIDMGVDLVVGMHPHVAQGAEEYKGKMIFYSLGNAVLNMAWEPTKYGFCVNVDLSQENPIVTSSYLHIGPDF